MMNQSPPLCTLPSPPSAGPRAADMEATDWLGLKQGAPSHPCHPHHTHSAWSLRACGHPSPQEGSEHCALRTGTQRGRVGTRHWFQSAWFLHKAPRLLLQALPAPHKVQFLPGGSGSSTNIPSLLLFRVVVPPPIPYSSPSIHTHPSPSP